MLALIIPTLNAQATLRRMIESHLALRPEEVIVVDGGSRDQTPQIAADYATVVLQTSPNRGQQLAKGALTATAPWFLFQHADTYLTSQACHQTRSYILDSDNQGRAAYFRLRFFPDRSFMSSFLTAYVRVRNRLFALPYGDQGLLISRSLYHAIGGYSPYPLMEDVAIIDALGPKRLTCLAAEVLTSAVRYEKEGYLRRGLRNLFCLTLYRLGVAPERIARLYS